jgi:hypothetical protein
MIADRTAIGRGDCEMGKGHWKGLL